MAASTISEQTRIIDITMGDLVDYLKECGVIQEPQKEVRYAHSFNEMAKILNVSASTMCNKKKLIKDACKMNGRKVKIDIEKAKELFYS